jgi:hypothetical protein
MVTRAAERVHVPHSSGVLGFFSNPIVRFTVALKNPKERRIDEILEIGEAGAVGDAGAAEEHKFPVLLSLK